MLGTCLGVWPRPTLAQWVPLTAGTPSARGYASMAEDPTRGRIVLFGGTPDGVEPLNDSWEWPLPNGPWQQVAQSGVQPAGRLAHSMAHWLGASNSHIVVFGGQNLAGQRLADTWVWTGTVWQAASGTGPSARTVLAMAPEPTRQRVLLFGGYGAAGFMGDTWEWDGAAWTQLPVAGPSPRLGHAMAYDPIRDRVVLFGGQDATGYVSDTWEWDGTHWTLASTSGPGARRDHGLARKGSHIVLFGGITVTGTDLADTWEWDGTNWVQTATGGPDPRFAISLASDSITGTPLLYGGGSATSAYDDTWRYTGDLTQGYIVAINAGLNLIANQLDHGSNTLNEVLSDLPDGSVLYKYNHANGTWSDAYYSAGFGSWMPNSLKLNPGEGAFLQSPTSFSLVFRGTPHVPVLPVAIPSGGSYLLSRQTNDVGTYDNIVGTAPVDGAQVWKWNGASGTYDPYQYTGGLGWDPTGPTTGVGEAVWISAGGVPPPTAPPANPFVVYKHLAHQALGKASVALTADGQLSVGNLGSSGQDGVSIALPDVAGFEAHWTDPNPDSIPATGSFLSLRFKGMVNGQADQPVGQLRVQEASGDLVVMADFSPLKAKSQTVRAYLNGVVVGQVSRQTGSVGTLFRKKWWKPSSGEVGWDDGPTGSLDWHFGSARIALNGGPTVDCDLLVVSPDGFAGAGSFSHVAVQASNWPDLTVTNERVAIKHGGLLHWTLGDATIAGCKCSGEGGPVTVGNLGSSGQDGVEIRDPRQNGAKALDLAWQDLDPNDALPVGAYLEAATFGTINGLANQPFMTTHLEKTGSKSFLLNVTHPGATSRTVEVRSGPTLVAVVHGQTGPVGIISGGMALDYHAETKVCTLTWFGPGRPPWAPPMDNRLVSPVHFQLTGLSAPVIGDRLVIRPENAAEVASGLDLQVRASQIPEIVLTEDSHRVPFNGIDFNNVGSAKLSVGANGVSVRILDGDPEDCPRCPVPGVRATFASASGFDVDLGIVDSRPALPEGSILQAAFTGAAGTKVGDVAVLQAQATGLNWVYTAQLPGFGNSSYNIEAYLKGVLVARATNQSGGLLGTAARGSSGGFPIQPFFDSHYLTDEPPILVFTWNSTPVMFTINQGPSVNVDELRVIPSTSPSNLIVSALELRTTGITNLLVKSARMRVFTNHVPVVALGDGSPRPNSNNLTVANLGSSGQDGASFLLGSAGNSTLKFRWDSDPYAEDALRTGDWLQADVTGSFNGVPNQPLGNVRYTVGDATSPWPLAITADFSPIGAPSQLLIVRNNGTDVGVFPGHTGPVGSVSGWPIGIGKTFGQTKCIIGDYAVNTSFQINGVNLVGDQLLILAEGTAGHVDYHSAIGVRSSGLTEFTVTGVDITPLTVGQLHNAALAYFFAHNPLPAGTVRLTPSDVNTVLQTIGDFLISSGSDPASFPAVTNELLQAYQRRGMFYTDGGAQYFGSPVSSDDAVPYDLADMAAQGLISPQLQDAIARVNSMIVTGPPPPLVLAAVSNTFLVQTWPPADQAQANAFGDVFLNSYQYWSTGGGAALSIPKWLKVVLADAKGAVEGAGSGAAVGGVGGAIIGGVIVGAAESIEASQSSALHLTSVVFNGNPHVSSGPLVLDVQGGQLIANCPVGWVDPSTLTNIEMANFGPAGSFDLGLASIVAGSAPGASLTLTARGMLNGQPNQPLGSLSVSQVAPGTALPYTISADFSSISSPSQLVEVWNGSTLLASFPGHIGPVAQVERWPDGLGKLSARTECYRSTWKPPIRLLINGINFMATELRVLAESPVGTTLGFKTGYDLATAGIGSYVITGETFGPATDLIYAGFWHHALGNAGLTVQSNVLIVSNLGTNGQDGVSVGLTASNSHALNIYYETPQTNGTVTLTRLGFMGGKPAQPVFRTTRTFLNGDQTYSFDTSPQGAKTYTLLIFNGHTQVYASHGNDAGTAVIVPFKYRKLPLDDVHMGEWLEDGNGDYTIWCPGYTSDTAQDGSTYRISGGSSGGATVFGDRLLVIPENPQLVPDYLTDTIIQRTGQITELRIHAESLTDAHTTATALGGSTLTPISNRLTVGNLGSSGQDGVSLDLGNVESFNLDFDPIDPATVAASGAVWRSRTIGSFNGVTNRPLDELVLIQQGTRVLMTADFSALGAATQHIQVFNSGVLIADFAGHVGPVGTASDWPTTLGKLGRPTPCRVIFWKRLTLFNINGAAYVGDEIRVLAEGLSGSIDYLSRFDLTAVGLGQFTLHEALLNPAASRPVIMQQPLSLIATSGSPAQLTAQIYGSLPMSYMWGVWCPPEDPNYPNCGCTPAAQWRPWCLGCPPPFVDFPSASARCGGSYYLVASNAYGMITSQVATVTIQPLRFDGFNHDVLGAASLAVASDQLLVSNLGSSGQDGVSISLGKALSCEISLAPLNPGPMGSFLQFAAAGSIAGASNQPLGYVRVTHTSSAADGYQVAADLTPDGSLTQRIEVWNNGVMLAAFPGHTGPAATVSSWPISAGKLGRPWPFRRWPCFWLGWAKGAANDLWVDGVHFVADELRILQETGTTVDYLSTFAVTGGNLGQITITGETAEQAPVIFDGLVHTAVGSARLDVVSNELFISNLGSSGQDGVSFGLAASNNHTLNAYYQVPREDGTVTLTRLGFMGGQPGQPVMRTIRSFQGEDEVDAFDTSPQGANTYTLRIYNGVALVYESHGNTSGGAALRKKRFHYIQLPMDDVHMGEYTYDEDGFVTGYVPGYTTDTYPNAGVVTLSDGGTVIGDRILVIPENPLMVPDYLTDTIIQASGQITGIKIHAESLSDAHTTATALGGSTLTPISNRLTVANLGSSGQDGVSLDLGRAESFDLDFDPIDPASVSSKGAIWRSRTIGSFNGVTNSPLDELVLSQQGATVLMTADFAALGAATQHIQVFNSGVLIADFAGHTGPIGTVSDWPTTLGKLGRPTPCRVIRWKGLKIFNINGAVYVGDEIRVLAEGLSGSIDYLSRFELTAVGLGQLTLHEALLNPTASRPAIMQQPLSLIATSGSPAQLTAQIYGSLPMSYMWGVWCPPEDPNYPNCGCTPAALWRPWCLGCPPPFVDFPSVSARCGGSYYLVASNAYGMITSQVATVTVQPLRFDGFNHDVLGTASLAAPSDQLLVVGNIGSSGQDGVTIDLHRAASAHVSLNGLPPGTPIGAFIQFGATGSIGGIPGQSLGYLRVTHVSSATDGYEVTADLSPDGSPTQRVEVWGNGSLLAAFPGHVGVVARVTSMPIGGGKLRLNFRPPILGCFTDDFPPATDIFVNGIHFVGDQLRVLQESGPGADYLSAFNVTGGNLGQITIRSETAEQIPVIFDGLVHAALGRATLDIVSNDLVVSNLGSSGQDGVSVALGVPTARVLNFHYPNPQGDGTLTLTSLGSYAGQPVTAQAVMRTIITFTGDIQTYAFDPSPQGASTYTMRIFDGSRLVFESQGNSGASLQKKKFDYQLLPMDDWHMGSYDDDGNYTPGTCTQTGPSVTYFTVIGGPTVIGNRVLIIPEHPSLVVQAILGATLQTAGQITAFQIHAESLSDAHTTATVLGAATFQPSGSQLTLANIGSSGNDGVSLDIGRSASASVALAPITPAPVGAFVQFSAVGSIGGMPDQSLGYLRVTHVSSAADGYEVTADLSPDGSPTQRVEVWGNGVLLAAFPGHVGPVAHVTTMPIGGGKLRLNIGPPIRGCFTDDFPPATDMFVNGIHFVGDQIRVLQESGPGVDYLSELNVTAANVAAFTISETSAVQAPVMFSGLVNSPVGNASLEIISNELVVAHIGSSGQDGVNIHLGQALSVDVVAKTNRIKRGESPTLSHLRFAATGSVGGVTNHPLGYVDIASLSATPPLFQVTADLTPDGSPTERIEVWGQGKLLGVFPKHSGVVATVSAMPTSFGKLGPNASRLPCYRGGWPWPTDIFVDGIHFVGDQLLILQESGPVLDYLSDFTITASNTDGFEIASESATQAPVIFSGYSNKPIGQVLFHSFFDVFTEKLVVGNIGSNGQDGVSIELGQAVSFDVVVKTNRLRLCESPTLSHLRFAATGSVGGVTNHPLGYVDIACLTTNPSTYSVTADLTPDGSPTQRIEVWAQGKLLAAFPKHTGVVATVSSWPTSFGKLGPSASRLPCYRGGWPWPTDIFVDGIHFVGDQLLILQESGPVLDYLSEFAITAANVDAFEITSESAVPLQPRLTSTLSTSSGVTTLTIQWTGGGVLQESADLGAWTDLTGATSPYTTPVSAPKKFYRVRQ